MLFLNRASIILLDRIASRQKQIHDSTVIFEVNDESVELYCGLSFGSKLDIEYKPCLPCIINIIGCEVHHVPYLSVKTCEFVKPKVSLTRTVISAYNDEAFISNHIFVDGDPIILESREFDILFYSNYSNRFIQTETDFVDFLNDFDNSLRSNKWYQKSEGGWLHRLIRDSKWNKFYIKARFNCLHFEDGLVFLENEELIQFGYEPLLKAFKIKYANTSSTILSDTEVACKLEEWLPRNRFKDHIDKLLDEEIKNLKTRKKNYFDNEMKEWIRYDGSLEAKKKIFLSQFSRYPEFEAKRKIIQKLIRKAENEVRREKGFTVVGSLINESILYHKIKEYFSNYSVISQYRSKWLGRQSLDIYIEEIKIGIEYQGDQHNRIVEFFGGEEAFEKTKERDRRKLERCRRNGCELIYVYPGYDFDQVVKEIIKVSKK